MEYTLNNHVTFDVVTRRNDLMFKCVGGRVSSLKTNRPLKYTASFRFHQPDVFDDDDGQPPTHFLLVTRNGKTLHASLHTGQQHNQFVTYMLYGAHTYFSNEEVDAFRGITGSCEENIRNVHPDTFPEPSALMYPNSNHLDAKLFATGDEVSLYW